MKLKWVSFFILLSIQSHSSESTRTHIIIASLDAKNRLSDLINNLDNPRPPFVLYDANEQSTPYNLELESPKLNEKQKIQ